MLPLNRAPTHPGQMLREEFLEPLGITQREFANHLGWTSARLNEIITGKRRVTADSALAFAEAFDIEAEFWLNLQSNWDLWHAQKLHRHVLPIIKKAA